jgi:hypothetical protein
VEEDTPAHEVDSRVAKYVEDSYQKIWADIAVVIRKGDYFSACLRHTCIPCPTKSRYWFKDQPYSEWHVFDKGFQEVRGLIRGSIIDDDQFPVAG